MTFGFSSGVAIVARGRHVRLGSLGALSLLFSLALSPGPFSLYIDRSLPRPETANLVKSDALFQAREVSGGHGV